MQPRQDLCETNIKTLLCIDKLALLSIACPKARSLLQEVMKLFSDIRMAFGESDEYSFVLHKNTTLYGNFPDHSSSP